MFLYEDKSYIKKSGFEAQKIGELRSMTYSCADDEKHRPSKATLFFLLMDWDDFLDFVGAVIFGSETFLKFAEVFYF